MAIRWLYEVATGTNYCLGMTSDDSNTEIPKWEDDATAPLPMAWSADDPALEPPAIQDLVPPKRYNIAQNKIYECNAAQNQAWNLREAKHRKNQQIDVKLMRLFGRGLTYDSKRFPLDLDDSVNYSTLYNNRNNSSVITWPHDIITRATNVAGDMEKYTISNANAMKQFGEAAFARMKLLVDGARDLKAQVGTETTVSGVNAIDVAGWEPDP